MSTNVFVAWKSGLRIYWPLSSKAYQKLTLNHSSRTSFSFWKVRWWKLPWKFQLFWLNLLWICDVAMEQFLRVAAHWSKFGGLGKAKWVAWLRNLAGLCKWGLCVLILVDLFTDHLPDHSPTPSCLNKAPSSSSSSSWCKSKMSEIGGGSHHKLHIPTVLSGCGGFRLNHTAYLERVTSLVLSGLVTNLILLFRLFQD